MEREELVSILSKQDAVVTFEKVDGSTRVMKCTLRPEVLPNTTGNTRAKNYSVLNVWDLEKDAWRAFRVNNVKRVDYDKK